MSMSHDKYREVAGFFIAEWTRRSESSVVKAKGKGCFVWDSDQDTRVNSSGMFYTEEMLPRYFSPEMAKGLQQMISEADHSKEVVVGMIFGDKAVGLRLQKTTGKDAIEVVPPLFHLAVAVARAVLPVVMIFCREAHTLRSSKILPTYRPPGLTQR